MIEGATKIPDPMTLPTMRVVASRRPRPRTSSTGGGEVAREGRAMGRGRIPQSPRSIIATRFAAADRNLELLDSIPGLPYIAAALVALFLYQKLASRVRVRVPGQGTSMDDV